MNFIRIPVFNPIIIDLPGPLAMSWYGLMYLLGLIFVYVFVAIYIKKGRVGLKQEQLIEILIRSFMGVLVGGRLGFVLFVHPEYYLSNPLRIFAVWEGGMYFFGGLIAAVLFPYFYARKNGISLIDIVDLIILPSPIALGFGRLGNFINGEFWGLVSFSPFALIFDSVPETNWFSVSDSLAEEYVQITGTVIESGQELINLPRHPVQLYELVLEGIVLFFILWMFRDIGKSKPRGSVFSLFLVGYGIFRFWIEFYREPVSHSRYLAGDWFTLGMLFCVPMILLGIAGIILSYRKNQTNMLYDKLGNPEYGKVQQSNTRSHNQAQSKNNNTTKAKKHQHGKKSKSRSKSHKKSK